MGAVGGGSSHSESDEVRQALVRLDGLLRLIHEARAVALHLRAGERDGEWRRKRMTAPDLPRRRPGRGCSAARGRSEGGRAVRACSEAETAQKAISPTFCLSNTRYVIPPITVVPCDRAGIVSATRRFVGVAVQTDCTGRRSVP